MGQYGKICVSIDLAGPGDMPFILESGCTEKVYMCLSTLLLSYVILLRLHFLRAAVTLPIVEAAEYDTR